MVQPENAVTFPDADQMSNAGNATFQILYWDGIFKVVSENRMDPIGMDGSRSVCRTGSITIRKSCTTVNKDTPRMIGVIIWGVFMSFSLPGSAYSPPANP